MEVSCNVPPCSCQQIPLVTCSLIFFDGHSWWFTGPGDTYASSSVSETDNGFTDSVRTVQEFIRNTGPYDGFLGFSQGAAFVAILLSMIEREEFFADLKFAILVAGFKSLCSPHSKYYQQVLGIPSLHVIGETDNIISKVRSEDLMSIFENPQILRHPGGHYVPCSKDQKEDYKRFLDTYTTKI